MKNTIRIIYKDNQICVIEKPIGMPSQSDPTGDLDALSAAAAHLASIGERNDLWLIHRLDRNVGGILVFARTKSAAAELSRLAASEGLKKEYYAVAGGSVADGELCDFLYKDSATAKAYAVKTERRGAKRAALNLERISERPEGILYRVLLKTGRFHQIRCQLASRGAPLLGDKKYGSRDPLAATPALFAYRLSFSLFGKEYEFSAKPDASCYPWNKFEGEF